MSAAVLTAGVVLEHLLLPAVHDAQGHAAVVHDSYSHAFCIECAVANLHQQQPPLSVLRRKRLLLGLEAALDLLLCLSPQASAPPQQHQQHQHQHHGYYHHLGGISGGGGCPLAAEAAQRMLEQGFLGAVLRPIADPHEREELADALIGATLKTVEAALQQQQGDLALALLAAIYGPVLDAIREQGVRQAGHLLRLVAALLTPQGGLQDLGSLLLPSGSHSHSHSQTVSPPSSHPSVAAFTASFVAFVELLGAELATPVPSPGSGSAAAAAAARLEMLALLRRLCECPPARAWVVRQRIAPRVCGPAFFQSMQGLLGGGGGTGADLGDDLQRNLLALALLLLPSPARGGEAGQYDGGGGSLGGGGSSGSGEATGPDGGIVLNELLCWEAETFCPVVVKPLLLSGSVDLQQGAAAFVARLVQARPEAAESKSRAGYDFV